jgi:YHS domain-containing protein
MLPCLVLAVGLGVPVFGLQPAPEPASTAKEIQPADHAVDFTVGDSAQRFRSRDALGRYLAIHWLPPGACESCARRVGEFAKSIPTLAGVRHVFVRSMGSAEFDAFLGEIPDAAALQIHRDDGTLASLLKLGSAAESGSREASSPALVLLDPQGREVHRWIGRSVEEGPSFASLAAKLGQLTRDPAIKESNLDQGLALQGYDPVAYLDEQRARPGLPQLESTFAGVKYRFASEEHRAAFNAEPEKYVPTYGGWCATAMAEGKKVEIDPNNFKVTNGRLFLFYKGLWGNALKDWNKDEPTLTKRADEQWGKLVRIR